MTAHSHPVPQVLAGLALVWLGLALPACSRAPEPVLDLKIAKGDWADYNRSLQAIADRQTLEERKEFEQALQELKFQSMFGDGPSKNPVLRGDVRAQLAGLTVRDVLVLSSTIRLDRKKEQEAALIRSIGMNGRLKTRPGDDASAEVLEGVRDEQARQLDALRADIAALAKRIDELSPPPRSRAF